MPIPELRNDKERVAGRPEAGRRALRRDAGERHGGARVGARLGREACSTATPCSASTTPSASRSTSPPTSAASAACASTWRASRRRWTSSASARARRRKFSMAADLEYSGGKTEFRGYDTLSVSGRGGRALHAKARRCAALKAGETGVVVLDQTPFYAESGGQVGDRGELVGSAGTFAVERHAEDPGRRLRPPRHAQDRLAQGRRPGRGAGRHRAARAHHAQPLGDAPDAQGAARGARPARAAEGLAGRRRQDALRLRARQADDGRGDPSGRAAGQRRDPAEHADARAGDADRGGEAAPAR